MHALEGEQTLLEHRARRTVAPDPVGGDNAVARNDQRVAVVGAKRPRCSSGAGTPCERSQLPVGDDLSPWDRTCGGGELALERCRPVEVDDNAAIRRALSGEMSLDASTQIRHERGADRCRCARYRSCWEPCSPVGGCCCGSCKRCPRTAGPASRSGFSPSTRARGTLAGSRRAGAQLLGGELMLDHDSIAYPDLAHAPAGHAVRVSRHAHAHDNTIDA